MPPVLLNATTLGSLPVLRELPQAARAGLAGRGQWREVDPRQPILSARETGQLAILLTGIAKIVRGGPEGEGEGERRRRPRQDVLVELIGPGQWAGSGRLCGQPNGTSCVAVSRCSTVLLSTADVLDCIGRHPAFAQALALSMAQAISAREQQIELVRGDVESRIHALVRKANALDPQAGKWLTNAEIARMVGATRVAVSQIVNRARAPEAPKLTARRKQVAA